jgi:hypothetical protein
MVLGNYLGHPQSLTPPPNTTAHAKPILAAMHLFWPGTAGLAVLREEIARQGVAIVKSVCAGIGRAPATSQFSWIPEDWRGFVNVIVGGGTAQCQDTAFVSAAEDLRGDLAKARFAEADDIHNILAADASNNPLVTWLSRIVAMCFGYVLLWSVVMLTFPHSLFVQSIVFFSPRMRKLSSLYLSEIFPLIPFARRRLLSPFRAQLGPRPELISPTTAENWFPGVDVTEGGSDQPIPIIQALPTIGGLTVLEGASGLGKTVYLVRLARDPRRLVAFVHAAEAGGDLENAIAARLPSEVMRDTNFLGSLIYAGGLDICVDGLNEVSPDARANVVAFARRMSKANILIATQPFRWEMPQGARVLYLQPLRRSETCSFLESREPILPKDAPVRGEQYREHVRAFLAGVTDASFETSEHEARDRALSNPMDLTTIALIIARGGNPDLLNLQEMAFQQAAATYRAQNADAPFPLRVFAECVYQRRILPSGVERDRLTVDDPKFRQECEVLADHRLLLSREEPDAEGRMRSVWVFRHGRISDFFLYTALTDETIDAKTREQRLVQHIDDPRFRGVYLLMALRSPLDFATWLRVRIADRAAETRDHALMDQFWSTVRQRIEAQAANDETSEQAA